MDMLDMNDPIIQLSEKLPWSKIENELSKYYNNKETGRPNKPIRVMVGLLLLKQIENLSDENVILQFKRNPYYQYFCGYKEYEPIIPCHPTELVKFRQRIGKEGFEYIFKQSIKIHNNKEINEEEVIADTTVQESNITYPTDGKLTLQIIDNLIKIAKRENIKLRRTYQKEIKEHKRNLRFFRHPKKRKKAKGTVKRLKTIAKILIRDIDRKFGELDINNLNSKAFKLHKKYAETFYLYMRVLLQTKNSKNKIYSLNETDAYALSKGKDHKKYEYGTKASILTTKNSGIILAVMAHKENIHDSKTLEPVLTKASSNRDKPIKEVICDRGYRGKKEIVVNENKIKVSIPEPKRKKDSKKEILKKRKKFRRRASIEPIIGHLKSDHRLSRNYLKGFIGDEINLLLAAAAFNLKKWMNIYFFFYFLRKDIVLLFIITQIQISKYNYFKLLLIRNKISYI